MSQDDRRPAHDVPPGTEAAGPSGAAGGELDLAHVDPLTGAGNRRLLDELLTRRWGELTAAHGRVALVIVDLDAFKAVNDRFGHAAGDHVLTTTAELLRQHFRQGDVLARYGGDEFVVVVQGAGSRVAATLAARARRALDSHPFTFAARDRMVRVPLSFSLGVASYPEDGLAGDEVFAAADHRLYAEKRRRSAPVRWRRAALVGLVALLVAAALALLVRAELGRRHSATTTASVTVATPEPDSRQAELDARITELQAEVDRLRGALAHGPPATPSDPKDDEVAKLESVIRSLTSELAAARRAAAPTQGPAEVTPAAAAHRVVRNTVAAEPSHVPTSPAATPLPVERPPVLLQNPEPEYPAMARALRREAAVTLRVRVTAAGEVAAVEVVGRRVGFGFDEAALAALRRARFRPATRDGVPIPGELVLVVRFTRD